MFGAGEVAAVGNRKLMVEEDVDGPFALMGRRDELAATGGGVVAAA